MKTATACLLLASLPATSFAGSSSQDAAALLDAQRAGVGDPAAIARLGVVSSRGTITFEGFPGEGTFSALLAPGGAARMEALFTGAPRSLTCTNGELYWMTGTGGVEIKRGWSAAADKRSFALGRQCDWREVYAAAELAGEAVIEGRACRELRLIPRSPEELGIEAVPGEEPPAPDTWWLDKDSNELVRVASYATVSGAGWQRLVVDYSDWRTVAGVRFPFKSRLSFGPADHQLRIVLATEGVEVDVKLERDPFQPDEQVMAEFARASSGARPKDPGFALQQRKPARIAAVRVKCKPDQIQQQLAIILPEVMGYLRRERLTPVGAPFARYHATGAEIDLEAGIPVAETIAGDARVKASMLPGGDVVSGMHVGPYHELERTHEALARWIAAQGLTAQGGPWEVYWTDPGLERDPSKWRTEIFQPVAARPDKGAPAPPSREAGGTRQGAAAPPGSPQEDVALRRLDVLVGTWKVKGGPGGPEGQVTFEWFEGGHFLLQRVDLVHDGQAIRGLEIIGRGREFGAAAPSPEITSRFYDNLGNKADYTWELGDGTLTIWGGEKGSPVSFRGTFSADGNTLTGAWKWPGGGYASTATRVVGSAVTAR